MIINTIFILLMKFRIFSKKLVYGMETIRIPISIQRTFCYLHYHEPIQWNGLQIKR